MRNCIGNTFPTAGRIGTDVKSLAKNLQRAETVRTVKALFVALLLLAAMAAVGAIEVAPAAKEVAYVR